ncbi:MAG TPA: hypothetical protein VGG48_14145 [Rhizomicrobium sp.]|jgi:hypothetical protein
MNYAIYIQPFLQALLYVVVMVIFTLLVFELKKFAFVKNNATLSDTLSKLAWDAAHFALAAAQPVAGKVGNIYVADPLIATAANWLLKAATTEIEGLNLSEASIIAAVSAIIPQAKAALAPSLPAPKENT